MTTPTLTPWPGDRPPSEADLDTALRAGGLSPRLSPRWWSNAPGDTYAAHSHPYHKVLYCARGSIRFQTDSGDFHLSPGDRLDIPPGVSHSAVVGAQGVACVEAARP